MSKKYLSEEQKKPEFQHIRLTPKFTGKGWKEGEEEFSNIMVYTDAKIAVFAPVGTPASKSARYVCCDNVDEFAKKFSINIDDVEGVRRRMKIFLERIKAKK